MPAMKRALPALLLAAALALPAGIALAAKLTAPSSARVGQLVSVKATGLNSGRYTLTLVTDNPPGQRAACVARLAGPSRPSSGKLILGGTIPKKLQCWENDSVKLGTSKVTPGAYHLVVAVPDGPSGFSAKHSFVRRALTIKR
jgi:hypothetical protein